ncbi:Gfo/Idh/MocA family protein [Tardiphaga sp. 866_E4_N2_1]|uniref:Gfo/Idh/MocA family protein n=1 Tax=unclassified Tardiphaga TaxID=2631404 RepID=UPI003F2225AB
MKTALVGLGRMGLRHLEVLRAVGVDVVGVSDMNEAARSKAATDFGLGAGALFADASDMIRHIKPELLVVATTAPSHAELVCLGAEQGAKAILCEKPMAISLAECDRMIAACDSAGTRLAINHQMRFMEQYTKVKEIVDGASFGGLASATVIAGNFGMAMNGSHYFEMFRFLTDEMPARVSAWFSADTVANPRGAQFEDRAGCVRITTASGRRFYMDVSTDHGHGMHVTYAGPFGRLDVDELAGKANLVVRKAEHRDVPTTRYGMPYEEHAIAIVPADAVAPTRAVLEALMAGKNYPDGIVGRMAVEVLAAAYLSDEQGGAAVDLTSADLQRSRVFPWA